tara:strand:+ start:375 stop:968 length:594 start_codon:yes stop_codon:yes gene_type:complete
MCKDRPTFINGCYELNVFPIFDILYFAFTSLRLGGFVGTVATVGLDLAAMDKYRILVLASVALELAKRSLRRSDKALTRDLMLVAGAASVAFLVGQLVFWNALGNMGYFASSNAANAFFYLLTGLHGVHLLGGLVAWVRAIYRLNHDNSEQASAKAGLGVELCATYWHFLLFVWLGLFVLLSSSPATYAAIAKLCGF